jgi:hypothetical protein
MVIGIGRLFAGCGNVQKRHIRWRRQLRDYPAIYEFPYCGPHLAMSHRQQGRRLVHLSAGKFRHNNRTREPRLPVTLLGPANGLLRYAVAAWHEMIVS